MLKVLFKIIIFALFLTSSTGQLVHAETRLYQYDGKMPFVKMMLNMMVAMGILDRVPANGVYGLQAYPGLSRSGYNNRYLQALALRGIYPGNTGNTSNPFLRSPWLSSPWTRSGQNATSPLWGSPNWGVMPQHSYAPYGARWLSTDLSGWVNEPWEASEWNPESETATAAETAAGSSQSNVPLVQNFNYNVPEKVPQANSSPLRKLVPEGRSHRPPSNMQSHRQSDARQSGDRKPPEKYRQKPCITDFCGLKKPDINGLWVAQNGEMLGVNNQRYLWSDGYSRHLTGQIKVQNEYLLTSVDDHDTMMRFKYKLAGNHMLTLRPDGTISEFVRMPVYRFGDSYRYSAPGHSY